MMFGHRWHVAAFKQYMCCFDSWLCNGSYNDLLDMMFRHGWHVAAVKQYMCCFDSWLCDGSYNDLPDMMFGHRWHVVAVKQYRYHMQYLVLCMLLNCCIVYFAGNL